MKHCKQAFAKMNGYSQQIKKILLIFLFLFFMSEVNAKIVDGVVAVVNEDIITYKELEATLKPYIPIIKEKYSSISDREKAFSSLKKKAINELINQKLIIQRAKLLGVKASDEQVEASIEEIKKDNSINDEQLKENLTKDGLTLESLKKKIREQIIYSKISNYRIKTKVIITEEEIKKYYEENLEKYGGIKKYHIRNIVIQTPQFMDDLEKAKIIAKVATIEKKLEIGIPFDVVAKKFSEGGNSDIGFLAKDDIIENIWKEIEKIKIGEYTKTIETKDAYQIFYLEEIKESSATPLNKVKDEIEKKLYKQAFDKQFQDWIKELKSTAYIKIEKVE